MKILVPSLLALLATASVAHADEPIPNPQIDGAGYLRIALETEAQRRTHRLSEDAFLEAMHAPGVVILDARSEARFRQRHLRGAVNLPFTEFTAAALAREIPRRDTRVLIYCNNNFTGSPDAFAPKAIDAALNLNTFGSLRAYGYTNVFELGPLLDVSTTRLPFAGAEVDAAIAGADLLPAPGGVRVAQALDPRDR